MHTSVLLEESLQALNLEDDSVIVDCTLGFAGHSKEILKRIKNGHLFAFDQDINAINYSEELLSKVANNYTIIKSNFKNLKKELNNLSITKVDGFLFDLGVSSPQLDEGERGFSFHEDARLDMRMDESNMLDAHYVVNQYPQEDLVRIFFEYGEEKYAKSIARNIIKARDNNQINTTLELVEIIKSSVPDKYKRDRHPGRKVFQAIRIEVNKELDVIKEALHDAISMLNTGGRIAVITFHSLEDKLVKRIFKEYTKLPSELHKLPVIPEEFKLKYKELKRILPNKKEIEENRRSRSATLRIIERL